jgi:hypothetical protein
MQRRHFYSQLRSPEHVKKIIEIFKYTVTIYPLKATYLRQDKYWPANSKNNSDCPSGYSLHFRLLPWACLNTNMGWQNVVSRLAMPWRFAYEAEI